MCTHNAVPGWPHFLSPSGRPTLILSRASRFCTSLWMLWATPGYCQEEGGVGSHARLRDSTMPIPDPTQPPHSPGSSQLPQSHPLAHLGVPAQWKQQQRALPPERPPCPASPCPAPLLELSEGSEHDSYHHGSSQRSSFPVPSTCVSEPGAHPPLIHHLTDVKTKAQEKPLAQVRDQPDAIIQSVFEWRKQM